MRRLLALTLCAWSALTSFANPGDLQDDYVVRSWTAREGLPLDTVKAMAQTPDGFLWIATFNGLARFDGNRFDVFQISSTPELPNNLINALFCDRRGRLWIGHETGHVTLLEGGHFKPIRMPTDWWHEPIHCFGDDAQGNVYMLNRKWQLAGLKPDGNIVQFPRGRDAFLNLDSQAADGILRATTFKGRCFLVRADGLTTEADPEEPPVPADGRWMLRSSKGGYWAVREGKLGHWLGNQLLEDLGKVNWGYSVYMKLCEWGDKLAGGTFSEGVHVAGVNGVQGHFSTPEGLPSASVTSLLVDKDQNLWVGTSAGLVGIWPKRAHCLLPPGNLSDRRIQGLAPAAKGGVWVTTEDAGLYHYDTTWRHIEGIPDQIKVLTTVDESASNCLWVGIGGKGLGRLENGIFTQPVPEISGSIRSVFTATNGDFWVGSRESLFQLAAPDFANVRRLVRDAVVVTCIEGDGKGGIWFGTTGVGLGHSSGGEVTYWQRKQGIPSENIFALHRSDDETLWCGTDGSGLMRLKNGKVSVITTKNGLPSDTVVQIIDDDQGRMWLGTYAGICAVDLNELNLCAEGQTTEVRCLTLDTTDGLATRECSTAAHPSACRTQDGRLWFATRQGLVAVNPAAVHANTNLLQVRIAQLVTASGPVILGSRSNHITLPLGERRVEIAFNAPSLKSAQRVHFKHQLEPVEKEWSSPHGDHAATYAALPPGDYQFRVAAGNEDGFWNPSDTTIAFTIPPFLWERAWFAPVCWIGSFLAVISIIAFWIRSRVRRRVEELERQQLLERERARISKDLHDDLGGSLTEVNILATSVSAETPAGQIGDCLSQIVQKSESMVCALDEIIWAINPHYDSVGPFADYLSGYAGEFLGRAGIRLRLDMQTDLPLLALDSERRHSLFLAAKESLTNVVRHAAATEVVLRLHTTGRKLLLIVEDNGKGFEPGESQGHGLGNLCTRMAAMQGQCRISRRPEGGTRVELELPLL